MNIGFSFKLYNVAMAVRIQQLLVWRELEILEGNEVIFINQNVFDLS